MTSFTPRSVLRRVRAEIHSLRQRQREARWRTVSASGPFVRHEVRPGLFLDLPSGSELSRLVYVDDLEATERGLLPSLLRSGDGFIDVGANFGLYTVDAATLVGASGSVLAFEPSLTAYANLQHNLATAALTNVDARQMALSDRAGEAALKVSKDGRDAWNTFGASLHGAPHEIQPVVVATLDSVLAAKPRSFRPALMKVDVEGWEHHVLRGAASLLARADAPILQVEFAPPYFVANGLDITILRDEIVRHGYVLYVPSGARALRPHRTGIDELAENLFAAKPAGPWFSRIQALLEADPS